MNSNTTLLRSVIQEMPWFGICSEKTYNKLQVLADQLEHIFSEKNKTICSHCTDKFFDKASHFCGCCSYCYHYYGVHGYFEYYNNGKHMSMTMKKIQDRYCQDNVFAYFDNNRSSCSIPRPLRSHTCLSFYCESMKLTDDEKKDVERLCRKIYNIKINNSIAT